MRTMKETLASIGSSANAGCKALADELRLILKDEGMLIFFIIVPLFYPLLYSWIYTNEVVREVPVAVVDMSRGDMSRRFTRMVDASPSARVALHCNSLEEAKAAIGRQEVYGVIYLPSDFQTNVYRLEQSHVSVYCDMSFMLYYKSIFQTVTAVAGELNSRIQVERAGNWTDREDAVLTAPIEYEAVPIFNTTEGYGNFIIPGVLMLIIQQTLLLGVGLAAGTESERRRRAAMRGMAEKTGGILPTVTGKALCYLIIYSVMAAYLTLVVPRLFSFTSLTRATDLAAFMLPYLLACVFFSMAVSFFVRYRENVILLVVFTSIVFLFMSGVSWPQSSIPDAWRWIASLVPSTHGIRGFVRMNTMGARLGDVTTELTALWTQAAAYLFLTLMLYWRRARKVRETKQDSFVTN